jgi:hypothetical protein
MHNVELPGEDTKRTYGDYDSVGVYLGSIGTTKPISIESVSHRGRRMSCVARFFKAATLTSSTTKLALLQYMESLTLVGNYNHVLSSGFGLENGASVLFHQSFEIGF